MCKLFSVSLPPQQFHSFTWCLCATIFRIFCILAAKERRKERRMWKIFYDPIYTRRLWVFHHSSRPCLCLQKAQSAKEKQQPWKLIKTYLLFVDWRYDNKSNLSSFRATAKVFSFVYNCVFLSSFFFTRVFLFYSTVYSLFSPFLWHFLVCFS